MIEIEMRGRLTANSAATLRKYFRKFGRYLETHTREQILLFDYPGYNDDPTKRTVDIRLRNTDGACEIMVKKKVYAHNTAREETSLKIQDTDLKTAQGIAKAFGCSRGMVMRRKKEIYRYKKIEWSIVSAGKQIFFFEAERRVKTKHEIARVRESMQKEVRSLDLQIFTPQEFHDFTKELARKVNKKISW